MIQFLAIQAPGTLLFVGAVSGMAAAAVAYVVGSFIAERQERSQAIRESRFLACYGQREQSL